MKKLLLLAILLSYSFINAQISFEKGYFISNNGTRTECFIKNIDWNYNPTDFKYKINSEDTDTKTETITNVQEFGIENHTTYKRAKVNIDLSSDVLESFSTDKNPIWKEQLVFLKVLVKGEASLYYYTNNDITRFFYETKERSAEQLVHKEYIAELNNSRTTVENNYFRQQLFNNVKTKNTTEYDVKNLPYKKEALMKYFLKYNNISSDEIEKTITSANKSIYHLKITPGIGFSSISIDGINRDGYNSVDYSKKATFKIGLEGELILPFNKNKWSLFINPTYQQYENKSETGVINYMNDGMRVEFPSEVKYSAIQIPFGVRHYFFLSSKSKIFINAGYAIDVSGKFKLTSKPTNLDSSTSGNFLTGLGYNFKNKVTAEIRANSRKDILTGFTSYSGAYRSLDFILGYTIF
ncbi:porin family protein [Flavobacterium collinsii]|uniref:Outer membrane protein beta-barrel domain-containing protein n=1 Tax=Flavobacterium collinsii TaxID=1114861 RepID=A0ABN7EIN0_9FLAO|nr:hypothetical protein [Flavobacterium collinsii]GIQ60256.1 hypothetical protein Flavo103_33920 [Flavobacterium collinsii]CAA9198038.1 hypothetical protein FLACOL7796_01983 [Flavobacterium collinsii]